MDDPALSTALDRIERAVARIEGAGAPRARASSGLAEAYALLDERHGLLRLRIQETIERLDALIGATDGAA